MSYLGLVYSFCVPNRYFCEEVFEKHFVLVHGILRAPCPRTVCLICSDSGRYDLFADTMLDF